MIRIQSYLLSLALMLLTYPGLFSQETFPRNDVLDERTGAYAFTHATIVTEAGTSLEDATLLIREGKSKGLAGIWRCRRVIRKST